MTRKGRFVDVSERAIVSLVGAESLDLLQRISTNDVEKLTNKETVQTVLTNEKGRIVEVVSVLEYGEGGLLLVGQTAEPFAMKQWIEKYVIMEDIMVTVLPDDFIHFIVYDAIKKVKDAIGSLMPTHSRSFEETLATVKLTHMISPKHTRVELTRALMESGLVGSDRSDYEEYRVVQGIPVFPNELSTSYNPLEAGLLPLVSFTKGCYIGQEVIARLDSYNKVQRHLVKLKMEGLPMELPERIFLDGEECGTITSALKLEHSGECRGLGYVKSTHHRGFGKMSFRNGNMEIGIVIDEPDVLPI